MRQRAKGVTLEVKNTSEAQGEEGEEAAAAAEDHGLDSTFTSQKDGGEVDTNMMKYIEEQMQKQGGSSAAEVRATPDDEDGLYTTPAHLIGKVQATEAELQQEDANRWLAGIQEVALTAEDKMATIEQTEAAKRKMMAAKVSAMLPTLRPRRRVIHLRSPANVPAGDGGFAKRRV